MSAIGIPGPMIATSDLEAAVIAAIEEWHPSYLSEVERRHSLEVPTLARLRSAQTSYDFENWTEGQFPALIVVSPGTVGAMERENGGSYNGWFETNVGVLVEDSTEADARRVAALHQAAIEAALIEHGSLGGFAQDLVLISRQPRLPDVANRTLAYAESTFHILVEGIVSRSGGSLTPPEDPNQPWPALPEVADIELDITSQD